MTDTNNPPAFPITIEQYGDPTSSGLTMRDYFAAVALGNYLYGQTTSWNNLIENAPLAAYKMADAMLKARQS